MRTRIAVLLMFLAGVAFAATRNIVPRATNEGGLGTSSKKWATVYSSDVSATYGVSAATGVFTGALSTTDDSFSVGTSSLVVLDGNTTVGGAFFQGAVATRSSATAAGAWTFYGAAAVSDDSFTVGTSTLVVLNGEVTIGGVAYQGAIATRSTMPAAGSPSFSGTVTASTGFTATTGNITATAGSVALYSRTAAQLLAITPTAAGELYICSDCQNNQGILVISTGTGLGGFGMVTSTSTAPS